MATNPKQSRNTWQCDVWNGTTYVAGATIYVPNANFPMALTSTQMKLKLANGDNAYINPEILYTREQLTFQWLEILNSDTFDNQIMGYVQNASQLRITTHLGTQFIGQFISFSPIWLLNEVDTYDIQAVFERTLG